MHYLLFGKFCPQTKLLDPSIKVYHIDREGLINMYANKYKNHKLRNNQFKYDVFFLEKAKIYRLGDQFENNGDVIMIDPNDNRLYNYQEEEIQNKSLSEIYVNIRDTLKDNNIVIHLFSNI
jgi:hypothetical protein